MPASVIGTIRSGPKISRIICTDDFEALKPCGLVIEAILEDLKIKKQHFAALEALVANDAVLATNTSSLSIAAIAALLAASISASVPPR